MYEWDDITKYTHVTYRGNEGYILDKGDHVSKAKGEHVYIELDEEPDRGSKEIKLHRRLVEQYIQEQRVLWIDWRSDFTPDLNDATES